MSIRITNHYCGDNGIVSRTNNISNIIDKLIRLAAKLTETYASDIMYDVNDLHRAVNNENVYDVILFFRENGITTCWAKTLTKDMYSSLLFNFTVIQAWRLTHNPVTEETRLIRVDVC